MKLSNNLRQELFLIKGKIFERIQMIQREQIRLFDEAKLAEI